MRLSFSRRVEPKKKSERLCSGRWFFYRLRNAGIQAMPAPVGVTSLCRNKQLRPSWKPTRVQRIGIRASPIIKKKAHPTLWCTLCICLWRIWVNTHLHPLYFITIQQGKKEREREDKLKPKPKQTSPQGSSEYAEVRCCVYSYANLSSCKSPHIKWILCTRLLNNELSPFQLFLALFRFANSSAMFTGLSAGDARVLHRLLRVYRSDLKRRATPRLSAKERSSRNLRLCPDL